MKQMRFALIVMLFLLAFGATSVGAQGEILPAQAIEISVGGTPVLTVILPETGNQFGIMVPVVDPGMTINSSEPFPVTEGAWDGGSQELTLGSSYAAEATAGGAFGSGSSNYSLKVESLPVGGFNTMVFELPDICQSVTEAPVQELRFSGQPLHDVFLLLAQQGDRFGLSFGSVQNVQLRSDSSFISIEGEYGLATQVLEYGKEFTAVETVVGGFGQPSEFTIEIPELPSAEADTMVFELPQDCGAGGSSTGFGSQNGALSDVCILATGWTDDGQILAAGQSITGTLIAAQKKADGNNDFANLILVQGGTFVAGQYGAHVWLYVEPCDLYGQLPYFPAGSSVAPSGGGTVVAASNLQCVEWYSDNGFAFTGGADVPAGAVLFRYVNEGTATQAISYATRVNIDFNQHVDGAGHYFVWNQVNSAGQIIVTGSTDCRAEAIEWWNAGNWGAAP